MKKILLSLPAISLFVPGITQAANLPLFNPDFTIVPEACHTCPCSFAGTLQLVQNVMNVMISAAVLIIIMVIVLAGFQFLMSAANPHGKQNAKATFVKAIIGFLVVLSAWIFVDFIMKTLYQGEGVFGPWNEIVVSDDPEMCIQEEEGRAILDAGNIGILIGRPGGGGDGGGAPSGNETAVRERLEAAGIGINKDACEAGQTSDCTNVGGMRPAVIEQVIHIKEECDCTVVITGGSEPGHAGGQYSHANGYKVDLRLNDGINTFLQSLRRANSRDGDARYLDLCGNEYVREGDHWDVTIKRTCTLH